MDQRFDRSTPPGRSGPPAAWPPEPASPWAPEPASPWAPEPASPWPPEPASPWAPAADPWAQPQPAQPQPAPFQPQAAAGWAQPPSPPSAPAWAPPGPVAPGRAQARRGTSPALIAVAIAAVVVLVAGVVGLGLVLAKGDDGNAPAPAAAPAPAHPTTEPAADPSSDPSSDPSTDPSASPAPGAESGGADRTVSAKGFSFDRPVGWRDESASARDMGIADLSAGERLDCALLGPPTRMSGTGMVVSSIEAEGERDAGRDDAEALGLIGVETLQDNPAITKVSDPKQITLGGQPAAQIDFRSTAGGEKVAGREILTIRDGRLWRILLAGSVEEFGDNAADLRAIVASWRWR
jgi:hypothetical protein